jgi:hypothetical protein
MKNISESITDIRTSNTKAIDSEFVLKYYGLFLKSIYYGPVEMLIIRIEGELEEYRPKD